MIAPTLLEAVFKINEVFTDADSAVLADPTGTFGVKRTDTGAILVAAGVAIPRVSAGLYRYTLTGQPGGVPLEWWPVLAWRGRPYTNKRNTTTPVDMPASYYGALQDVYDVSSTTNVNRFSNADRKATGPDLVRIQRVMLQIDVQITAVLGRAGVPQPQVGDTNFSLLTQAWAWLVLVTLYQARGDTQTDSDEFGRFSSKSWRDNATSLLEQYIAGATQNIQKRVRIDSGDATPHGPFVVIP
jgi:hypothetical protein